MNSTKGKVVVVTGASKGLGRGIARQFGRLGATVYITSRETSASELAECAEEIQQAGGKAVPLSVDHRDDAQVEQAIDRIHREAGHIDILVNNAAAVHQELIHPGPFWAKPLHLVEMIDIGLRSNYVTSYYAAPLMAERRSGLIANISFYGAVSYFHGPAYGAAKAGVDKMSFDMAVDLRPYDVACVSLWPGFIFTDHIAQLDKESIPPEYAAMLPDFERPEFSGLVLNALHDDPAIMELSGRALIGAELGQRYNIKDIDGKQPISYRTTLGDPAEYGLPSSVEG